MKRYQLVIAAKEQQYLRRLGDYIRDSPFDEHWQLTAFTNAEACRRHIEAGYTIDMLAIQPELYKELISTGALNGARRMALAALVAGRGESGLEHELLQYQPLPALLQGVIDIHSEAAGHKAWSASSLEDGAGARIVSVYSASGGTGKTALALHLTHAAGSQHYRPFYLNLERWNTSGIWLGKMPSGQGLSELLYELKSQPEQAGKWLLEHRIRHPVLKGDCLSACSNAEDRMTLGAEDAAALLALIKRSNQYDLIIVDMDDGMGELHMTVLSSSDQIVWLTGDDEAVLAKQRMALQYGEQKWGSRFGQLAPKIRFVRGGVKADEAPVSVRDGISYEPVALPKALEWDGAASAKLLSSPSYRAAAGKLLNHLLKGGERHAAIG